MHSGTTSHRYLQSLLEIRSFIPITISMFLIQFFSSFEFDACACLLREIDALENACTNKSFKLIEAQIMV